MTEERSAPARPLGGPWFQRHPRRALAVAVASSIGIVALRFSVEGAADAISVLHVLPVALVAMAFGFRAGVAAGVAAVGFLVTWVVWAGVELGPLGWVARVLPMLLIGGLVGAATDRIRAAEEAERRSVAIALLQREAAEINDEIVQGLAAAKWMLEAGDVERGLAMVEDTMVTAQGLVTRVLGSGSVLPEHVRRPDVVLRRHHGVGA